MIKKSKAKVGVEVKLSPEVRRPAAPEGREDNETAAISAFLPSIDVGAVMLNRDLHGCRYWNISDLELVL